MRRERRFLGRKRLKTIETGLGKRSSHRTRARGLKGDTEYRRGGSHWEMPREREAMGDGGLGAGDREPEVTEMRKAHRRRQHRLTSRVGKSCGTETPVRQQDRGGMDKAAGRGRATPRPGADLGWG